MARPQPPTAMKLFEIWTEDTAWLFQRTHRFPRHLRHSLTNRVELAALDVLEHLTCAAWERRPGASLRQANLALNRLRALLRLAHLLQVLSHDHYEEAARRLGAAGSMLGGWLRQDGDAAHE